MSDADAATGSGAPNADAWFEVRSDDTSRIVPLAGKPFWTLGREEDCDVVLPSARVSRKHAVLQRFDDGGYHLNDHGSRNGTHVNDRLLRSPKRLYDGDRVEIGPYRLVFRRPDGTVLVSSGDRTDVDRTAIDRRLTEVTVLVGDIRGFGFLTRDLGERQTGDMLHDWFAAVESVVSRHGGQVDKFVGDAVMAVWRHDRESESSINAAVAAGIGLFDATAEVSGRHDLDPPLAIGVGIHTGPAMSGPAGNKGAADFTVLGDTVNLAFRLESATRDVDVPMLVSAEVARLAGWSDPAAMGLSMHHLRLKHVDAAVAAWGGMPAGFDRLVGPQP